MNDGTAKTLADVRDERHRQNDKWGEQNHPDGTHEARAIAADFHRCECQEAARCGLVTWRHILMEEVAEAFAETDAAKLREELIQVAAVAVSWVEAIDRRGDA
jgi:hypothetical protein